MLAPGRSRPTTRIQLKLSRRKPGSLSALIGHQSSGLLPTTNPKKPGGATPIFETDDRPRLAVGQIVVRLGQRAAHYWVDPQHGEEIAGHALLLDRLRYGPRLVHEQPRPPYGGPCDDRGEGLGAVAEHFVERIIAVIAHA